jgi:Dyp-type peroxidase family
MAELERGDIQGNILRGYRYPMALHCFLSIDDALAGRALLGQLSTQVTSDEPWTADSGEQGKPTTTLNVALSFPGLLALGVEESTALGFPRPFCEGMRARHALLGDDPSELEPFWNGQRPHVWVAIHGRDAAALAGRRAWLKGLVSAYPGVRLHDYVDAACQHRRDGNVVEHFGFRDGLSSPVVAGSGVALRPGNGKLDEGGAWQPLAAGEFLLGHENESGEVAGGELPVELAQNGTFVVYRKLHQEVALFRDYLARQAQILKRDALDIATSMVGRTPDGRPLIPQRAESGELNDFSYKDDPDGARCPFGSHIRRVNPRDSAGFPQLAAGHQLLRRGMTYGDPLPPDAADDGAARGLLFIALNADLERQFEFVQQNWVNDGASARQAGDRDPIAGTQAARAKMVIQGDPSPGTRRLPAVCMDMPSFVRMRGGGYFFMPGLRALAALAHGVFGRRTVTSDSELVPAGSTP